MKLDIFGFDDLCVKVYDPATKTLLKTYKTKTQAANYLGLTMDQVSKACRSRTRRYSPTLQKEVALRISKN